MTITFTYPQLVKLDNGVDTYLLSDHGRGPMQEELERIENARRTARGRRRKYHINDMLTFSLDWEKLPEDSSNTADGLLGVAEMAEMVADNPGALTMSIRMRDSYDRVYSVHIIGFTVTTTYRYTDDTYYDCSLTLEQITEENSVGWTTGV
ncbi:MAG: hypothetical protein ACQ5SW_03375 [Sphaerochaetaceae bacterium]